MELADAARFVRVDEMLTDSRDADGDGGNRAHVIADLMRLCRGPLDREQHQHYDDDETAKHLDTFFERRSQRRGHRFRSLRSCGSVRPS